MGNQFGRANVSLPAVFCIASGSFFVFPGADCQNGMILQNTTFGIVFGEYALPLYAILKKRVFIKDVTVNHKKIKIAL